MTGARRETQLVGRLLGAVLAMVVAYVAGTVASGAMMGDTGRRLAPAEASQAGMALIAVAVVEGLVLSHLILRSRWFGPKLIGVVLLVHVGVGTLMTQIETLYYNAALALSTSELLGIVAGGVVRALVFAPLAVVVLGRLRQPVPGATDQAAPGRPQEEPSEWEPSEWGPQGVGQRLAGLAILYVIVYFAFGYAVAWQSEATRLYYAGTTEIEPLLAHFRDLFVRDPWIVPFQLLRGALWAALAALIVRAIRGPRWETALAVALVFTVLVAVPLGLFPNPYMPDPVRRSHFYEIASSMLLFGGIAGWVLRRHEGQAAAALVRSTSAGQR